MMLRAALPLALITGTGAASVPPANPKESNAVNKVMKMLTDLAAKVEDEGVKETKTYEKFSRFCKEAGEERNQAIDDGQVSITELKALIDKKKARTEMQALNIDKLTSEISTLKTEIEEATALRKKERTAFDNGDAEITAAIKALDRAVQGIQNSKKGPGPMSLLQQPPELKSAILLADSMGLDRDGSAASLLGSESAAPTVDYEFHSGGIVATLEKLQEEFRTAKTAASQEEITARGAHTMTMQEKQQSIDRKTREKQASQSDKDMATQAMGNAQKKLETAEATLGKDQQYASELNIMCTDKKNTFDERAAVRENELNALKSATDIMSEGMAPSGSLIQKAHPVNVNLVRVATMSLPVVQAAEAAAEAVEHKAPVRKVAFLQQRQASVAHTEKDIKARIVAFLRSKSVALKSPALLSLARHASRNDNLKAVRDMLQGMIDRLHQADADATDHKQFCDASLAENAEKRDEAARLVAEFNAKMATAQADRETLKEEISILEKGIALLTKNQEDTTTIREEESKENKAALDDAQHGKAAVEQAVSVLKAFYESNAAVMLVKKKAKQPPTGPAADAPDAGFKNFETNRGSQAEATGVLGMLDVILADMDRTIEETNKEEKKADQEHDAFMTESNTDKDQKNSDKSQKETEVAGLETDIAGHESSLNTQLLALTNTLNEAADLDASCNVKANFQERIERREAEMEMLKEAIEFFNDPTKTLALS